MFNRNEFVELIAFLVCCFCFFIVAGCEESEIDIHDIDTIKLIDPEPLYIINSSIDAAAFSPDERQLAVATSKHIIIYEVDTWTETGRIEIKGYVNAMVFSPDGRYLATENCIYKVGEWEEVARFKSGYRGNLIHFSPDGNYMAVNNMIYEVGTWNKVVEIKDGMCAAAFSPDGLYLAAKSGSITRVFSTHSWDSVFEKKHKRSVDTIVFSPDGKYLISGSPGYGDSFSPDDVLFIISTKSWKVVHQFQSYNLKSYKAAFSPDGKLLYISGSRRILIYDLKSLRRLQEIDGYRLRAVSSRGLIGTGSVFLDSSYASLRAIISDLKKLHQKEEEKKLIQAIREIETGYQNKRKIILETKNIDINNLASPEKSEWENNEEFANRIKKRNERLSTIQKDFQEKRLSLRRERAKRRWDLYIQYENCLRRLLVETRTPTRDLTAELKPYNAEGMYFPITVNGKGVEPYHGIISIPRRNAPFLKNNAKKLEISADVQLDRKGIKRLYNICIYNPGSGNTYHLGRSFSDHSEVSALPPDLTASDEFVEPSGDNALNAEESARLIVTIENRGKGSAFQVVGRMVPSEPVIALDYSPVETIPVVPPGEKRKMVFPILAGLDLPEKQVSFQVEFEEQNGFSPNPVKVDFQTYAVRKPDLQVVDYRIDDATQDGKIQPGEVIKATFRIQNRAEGTARNVRTKASLGSHVFPALDTPLEHELGMMLPNDVKEITIAFYCSQKLKDKVPVKIDIFEDRPRFNSEKLFAFQIDKKEKKIFTTIIQPEKRKPIPITDLESPSDLDTDIPKTGLKRKGVAVVIGNYDYKKTHRVAFARRDAVTMKAYLMNIFGFQEDKIIMLGDATLGDMLDTFGKSDQGGTIKSRLNDYIEKGDEIFVYYTGHGAPGLKNRKGYLVPIDANPDSIERTGYSLETLYANLNKLNARKTTVVIDACFSGESDGGPLYPGAKGMYVEGETPNPDTITVISSSTGKEISRWYKDKQHSLFTYFFLKYIKDQAVQRNNVSIGDLEAHVKDNVIRASRHLYGRVQTPQFKGNKNETLLEFK